MIKFLRKKGYNIFVCNVSFLGFPSFHVIVPEMSEVVEINLEEIKKLSLLFEAKAIIRNIPDATPVELEKAITAMKENYFINTDSIAKLAGIPVKKSFPWNNIKTDLFYCAAYYKIGNIQQSSNHMRQFVSELEESEEISEGYTYYKCVRDYLAACVKGIDSNIVYNILSTMYGSLLIENVLMDFRNPEDIFKYYGKLRCWKCSECSFRDFCAYENLEKLHMSLKEHYKDNQITQLELKKLGV